MARRISYNKLQHALALRGVVLNVSVSQFFSPEQKRHINKYTITEPTEVFDKKTGKKKIKQVECLSTYSYPELVKYLIMRLQEVNDSGG